jgi:hypothetical protein
MGRIASSGLYRRVVRLGEAGCVGHVIEMPMRDEDGVDPVELVLFGVDGTVQPRVQNQYFARVLE